MVIQTGDNKFGVAKWIVDPVLGLGTHTTISAAYTSAVAGDTIFVRDGTYIEDPTVKPGVNLTAFNGDQQTPNVIVVGKFTMTGIGTSSISNIRLQTNSDFFVSVSGSSASILNLNNCYLNCTNNTGISYSSSSSSSRLILHNCQGNLANTGIAYFTHTSTGTLGLDYCLLDNAAGSTTSNIASGPMFLRQTIMLCPLTTSNGCILTAEYSTIENPGTNTTSLTHNSTSPNSSCIYTFFSSGTASGISLGAGSTLILSNCNVSSSNTNAITESGASTLIYNPISFPGLSSNVNVTTQTIRNFGPNVTIGSTNSGNIDTLIVKNDSNTASSSARIITSVAGTTAQDPHNIFAVGSTRSYSLGIDNSDSQHFKITQTAASTVDPSSGTTVLTSDGTNIWVTGISFDSGSHVLSNYTNGTFTPTVVGTTTAGTTTYVVQAGYYQRIGSLVYVQATLSISAATGTGTALFGGLPFTIKNQANGNNAGSIIISSAAWAWPASTTSIAVNGLNNSITFNVFASGSSTAGATLQMTNGSATFVYSFVYMI
jgi:hypothetical protein